MTIARTLRSSCFNTIERGKAKLLPALLQLFAALLFDLGICRSGRHRLHDRELRAKCCNGYRGSWLHLYQDGGIRKMLTMRPITFADPRWSWETEPDLIPGYQSSVNVRGRRRAITSTPAQFGPPLSLIDAHIAAGSPWSR